MDAELVADLERMVERTRSEIERLVGWTFKPREPLLLRAALSRFDYEL